jgi:hypothetical protein
MSTNIYIGKINRSRHWWKTDETIEVKYEFLLKLYIFLKSKYID